MGVATKTGDDGYTDIIGGKRLRKDHPAVECLGTLDELAAFLGDAKAALRCQASLRCQAALRCQASHAGSSQTADIIDSIQKDLSLLMGVLAGMPVPADGMQESRICGLIAQLELELPPMTSFAVPGANPVSAKLHIARTVCRRAERNIIGLGLDEETKAAVAPYINRLSDLLFLLAQKEA